MFYEKIKVSLPRKIVELLQKDCFDFKLTKENGKTNMNAFINLLLANFYEEFSAREEMMHEELREALSKVPSFYAQEAFKNVLKVLNRRQEVSEGKQASTVFSFKPTKVGEETVLLIERALPVGESLSSYYRRLFIEYAKKKKNERELIILRENYEKLSKAIKKGMQVSVVLKNGEPIENATVYAVAPAKDELYNYALVYSGKTNKTLRLATIHSVLLHSTAGEIPEKNAEYFARQLVCGAQYPIYSTDDEPIKVLLTEKGKTLFQKIYLYRPEPVSIEGNIYTFQCSANQLLYYFERFGDSAVILSPKKLGIFMLNYHYFAYKKYHERYRNNRTMR